MEWLRLYSNIVNDPKIMQMSERYRWRYIALLCLFRINNDSMPSDSDIVFSMRIKKSDWNLTKNEFEKRGLLNDEVINGWSKRQYKSDNSYERVKRFRNANETLQKENETVTVTPPEQIQNRTDTETDTERKPQAVTLQTLFDNIQSNFTDQELEKCKDDFIKKWTEKSNNGKKERWQKEKTFDVNLRFITWIKNDKEWYPKKWKKVKYGID